MSMTGQEIAERLAVTQAMTGALSDYLMSDTLYQNLAVDVAGNIEHPVLTLGALLENLETLRWNESALTPGQDAQLAGSAAKAEQARRSFVEKWTGRLRRELKALLDSWKWYLDDAEDKDSARRNYPVEAHTRTRIDLVLRELGDDPAAAEYRQRLAGLDARLRGMWRPGAYIGPRSDQSHYPADTFWWLYGSPDR